MPVPIRLAACTLAVALLLSACAGPGQVAQERLDAAQARAEAAEQRADSLQELARLRNVNLHSTLWTQTSVEHDGLTRGMYRLAERQMRRALADSTWTAAVEQAEMGPPSSFRARPPAVVLDVDETVLDNSAYQARLILDGATYSAETWQAWCREENATAVPGALAFTQAAANAGVTVFYVTNRDSVVDTATRANLERLGFPLAEEEHVVLTEGERAAWDGSKTPRRRHIAEDYRILLLIGDNFGDFLGEVETSVRARQRRAEAFAKYWGTRWIVLPNPQYGSWEGALFDYQYDWSPLEVLRMKRSHLRPKRPSTGAANE
jgi:acid phosphatase